MPTIQRTEDGALELTEDQRRRIANRLMLQQPKGLTIKQIAAARDELDRRVKGLEPGMVLALGSLALLAEQGNIVAQDIFTSECDRLEIQWKPIRAKGR